MACACAIELQLALILAKAEALRLGNRVKHQRNQDEIYAYAQNLRNLSLPKLISKLRKAFSLSDKLIEGLEIAKDGRDDLAHRFWQYQIGNLGSAEGASIIARQCAIDVWHFKEVSGLLTTETGVDVSDYAEMIWRNAAQIRAEWEVKLDELLN